MKRLDDILRAAYEAGYVDADNGLCPDFEGWRSVLPEADLEESGIE